jgi:hypothetical protein
MKEGNLYQIDAKNGHANVDVMRDQPINPGFPFTF